MGSGEFGDPDIADAVLDDRLAPGHTAAVRGGGFSQDVVPQKPPIPFAGAGREVVSIDILPAVHLYGRQRLSRPSGPLGLDAFPFKLLIALERGSPGTSIDQLAFSSQPGPRVPVGVERRQGYEPGALRDSPHFSMDVGRLVSARRLNLLTFPVPPARPSSPHLAHLVSSTTLEAVFHAPNCPECPSACLWRSRRSRDAST